MDSFTSSMRNLKSFCSVNNNEISDANSASRLSVAHYSGENNSDPVHSKWLLVRRSREEYRSSDQEKELETEEEQARSESTPNDPSRAPSPEKLTYQQFDDKANEEAQASSGLGQNVLPEVLPRHKVPLTVNLIGSCSDVVHSTAAGEPQALNLPVQTILGKRKAVDAPLRRRKEAYVSKGKVPFVFEGEFWDPKWKVSNESSIFEMGAGGTSFELYKACMLPRDKARFIDAPHLNVEEYRAHFLMQIGLAMHQFSLGNSYWKNVKLVCDEQIASLKEAKKKLDADLSDAKGALKDALLRFDEMEADHTSELSEIDTLILAKKQKLVDLQHEMLNLVVRFQDDIKKEKKIVSSLV
ncbi:hypothetical protein BUALT_Bualt19G0078700 [Buddleja alternifolia]|uniref:Uncharacterized protein n=1 Tax=Buddleja alternifolia TaxID=168488 RepID=A0AAV6W8E4_9LAMI|nr:hypothetical protein BUALT_Bualt19G0078700 [Buddleja alternifolia]